MPMTVRGHVISGRLVVDVPTDLPDGTEVELVSVTEAVEVQAPARPVLDIIGHIGRLTPAEAEQDRRLLERDRVYGHHPAPDEE
jgi:hypothetical protein